jgi:hypothetical protein
MNNRNLNAFQRWSAIARSDQFPITSKATMNRFIARLNFATRFNGVDASVYTEKTLKGYSAIFHVYLAYSAFELLFVAIKKLDAGIVPKVDPNTHVISDATIASVFRSNKKFLSLMQEELSSKALKVKITNFEAKDENNLLVFAQATRHLVAHGHLSATGAQATTLRSQQALHGLAKMLLDDARDSFKALLDQLEEKIQIQ